MTKTMQMIVIGDDDKDMESDLSDDDDEDDNDCGKSRAGAENKTSECF